MHILAFCTRTRRNHFKNNQKDTLASTTLPAMGRYFRCTAALLKTKNKTEQTEYPWHFPCHWARALAQFQWTSMTMSNIDDDQRGREAANEACRWAVKWPQWPVHSASSPQTKIPLMESLGNPEIHREFSRKTGEKKHKQLVNNHVLQNWMIPLYTWFCYSCEIELV